MAIFEVTRGTDDGTGLTAGTLSKAILDANMTAGDDIIVLETDVTVSGVMKRLIDSNITITGDDPTTTGTVETASISGGNQYRPLFVKSGTVQISNLTLTEGLAQGGSSWLGGGGAGMGGALFIYDGTVTVENVDFTDNGAVGGNNDQGSGPYFGGGGMYGQPSASSGGGLFGSSTGFEGGYGGYGNYGGFGGIDLHDDGGFGGGGVVNGGGGFGGGGGSPHGNGGFGGGSGNGGGNGGYGGGAADFGNGGFGGGDDGGGGAGMGGAIFVRTGSLTVSNSSFTNNSATGGTGDNNGLGLGGAIFAMKSTTNSNRNNQGMPGSLPTVTLDDVSLSGNSAADDANTPDPTPDSFTSGTDLDNDDLFGSTISGSSIIKPLTIGGTSSGQTVNDNATISPFFSVNISHADGDNVSVTVTLDDADKGIFTASSLSASGFVDGGSGSYTLVSTTAAIAQTAIQQLVFDPTDNRVAPTLTETTTFTIDADDGTGTAGTASNNTTTVVSTSINESPTIATNAVATVNEGGNVTITTSLLNEGDPDDSGTELTYSITSSPSNGQLELTTASGTAISSFSQDDLDNNRVIYVHNGSETTDDSFNFSLADGGENSATPATGTFNITVDNTAPSLTSFSRQAPGTNSTNADTLVFIATFSEDVQNVDAADFTVSGGTTATVTDVNQTSASTYELTVSGGDLASFEGVVGLDLAGAQDITDEAGNALVGTDETYSLDNTAPSLTSFSRQTPGTNPTNAETLVFIAIFSEDVQNVDVADFTVSGGTTATVADVNQTSASTYELTVSGGDLASFYGLVGLDLAGGQDIADNVGNALLGTEPATDETYTLYNLLDLSGLDGANGFALNGIDASDRSGYSVSSAGDVNGDGFDDLIIGAPSANQNGYSGAGESYVVFGSEDPFAASLELSGLDGTNGFTINGIDANDSSGISVSGAGDVNADGFDDLIIGAYNASPNGSRSGESYVVFGSNSGFAASLDLSGLDGSNGFTLNGIDANDRSGISVSGAGDVNADGFDDLIIGAHFASPNGNFSGESYVVFGSGDLFAASLELSGLDGTNGFTINGIDTYDSSGRSVSSAGDVNGDGFDDLIIGASGASAGESYVVFGSGDPFTASLELSGLDGTNGFTINGIDANDQSGYSVSSAGDVNGDGFDDLIIGARLADPNGNDSGESYVVFGSNSDFAASLELSDLDGTNGFTINGIDGSDWSGHSVSGAGDVNADGFDDLIIGAHRADPNGNDSGESYVVFGSNSDFAASLESSGLDGTNGFTINGIDGSDWSGRSVSGAGDVNADGFDDLIIGAYGADPNGNDSGESYVVFGLAPELDTVPPTLTSLVRQTPATTPTNADTLIFRATFDEDVQNVDTADFEVNGSTTATVTNVSTVIASVYDITVSGGDLASFEGTVGLDLGAGQDIANLSNNALGAGEPAIDETYSLDNTAPTVIVESVTTFDSTPELTGTIDDSSASIQVTVNGNNYAATNNGDGTWTLADDTITPALDGGTYEVAVTATDTPGNIGNDSTSNELVISTPEIEFSQATYSAEESDGTTNAITLTRDTTVGTSQVQVEITEGTATGSTDYNNDTFPLTVTFDEGEDSKTVSVAILEDTVYEPGGETITFEVRDVSNASIGTESTATVDISDNDSQPTVTLELSGSSLAENDGASTVTATLSNESNEEVTVDLDFSGTATGSGTDYRASETFITIGAGSTTGSITLTGIDDAIYDDDETVIIDITDVTNGTEDGTQQITATITDDDDIPTLSIDDVTVTEGNDAIFTVSLSGTSTETVTVNYMTVDNTTTVGSDYTVNSNSLTFDPGETSQTLTVEVLDDSNFEGEEEFFVFLFNPSNATTTDSLGIGTITDNDQAVVDRALSVDGTGDYVEVPSDATLNLSSGGEFTLEAWIYPEATNNSFGGVIGYQPTDGGLAARYPGIWIRNKTAIHFGFGDGTNWYYEQVNNVITNNAWNHVATRFDGTTLSLFVNGEEEFSTDDYFDKDLNDTQQFEIGSADDLFFPGQIDEVRVWNIAREDVDIQADLYNTLSGSENGLVAYYNFNSIAEDDNTVVLDNSLNSNDGTLMGDATLVTSGQISLASSGFTQYNDITGDGGNNSITGTSGPDRITGGLGSDTLTGGAGNDEFIYTALQDASDTITDFTVGEDKVDLSDVMVEISYGGSSPIGDGYISFLEVGNDTIIQIDSDGSATGSAQKFLLIQGVAAAALNNSDNFIFL